MEKSFLKHLALLIILLTQLVFPKTKWNFKADGQIEQTNVNGESVLKLTKNVHFYRDSLSLYTNKALHFVDKDILHLQGKTMMIDGIDTLTCDTMIFWTEIDSIHATGHINLIQKNRSLTSAQIDYWKGNGYRGASFMAKGNVDIEEDDRHIFAQTISYIDTTQFMALNENARIGHTNQIISGDDVHVQYVDSLIQYIHVKENAKIANTVEAKVDTQGVFQSFVDNLDSEFIHANFENNNISEILMYGMASTSLNVIENSLYMGKNDASGDSIRVKFLDGELNHVQILGGGRGKFFPETQNADIDTVVTYAAEKIDYYIQREESFLDINASVEYQNTTLKADYIHVDWQTNMLEAQQKEGALPQVITGNDEPMEGESFNFDLNSKHGVIQQGRTTLHDTYFHGDQIYRDEPNIFHVNNSKYTSCDLDHPHYYLSSNEMKMLPGDRIIARPLWLYIHDIPIIGIPLAVFPSKGGGRRSGWIMPSFGTNASRGTYFRHLGYFWTPNDYMDAKFLLSFYDEHGFDARTTIKYKKRYKYNGSIRASILRQLQGSENIGSIFTDSTKQNWDFKWNHSQRSLDKSQNLNINYNYVSSNNYYQETGYDLETRLKQQIQSSLNYSKNWPEWKNSFTISLSETYDLLAQDERLDSPSQIGDFSFYKNRTLPNISFRHSQSSFVITDWINSIYWSTTSRFSGTQKIGFVANSDSTWADTTSYTKGISHNFTLSSPQKFFGWLSLNPKLSLKEDWVFEYRNPVYDENGNFVDEGSEYTKVEDFNRRLTGSTSLTANTKIYGLFPFFIGPIEAIRHVITPSISYTYRPDFSQEIWGVDPGYILYDNAGNDFDPFAGSTAGSTPTNEQKKVGIRLKNLFKMKLRQGDDIKKIDLLSWDVNTSYNMAADSLKWSTVNSKFNTTIPGGLRLDISATHDVYDKNDAGHRVDIFKDEWNGIPIPYLTKLNANTSFKLSGKRLIGVQSHEPTENDTTNYDDELLDMTESDISPQMSPGNLWQASFSLRYSSQQKLNHLTDVYEWDNNFWINTNLKIKLSQNWQLSYNTRFDVMEQEMLSQSFHFSRPLHCWEFTFKWWPHGGSKGFFLNISVKQPDLQDIKVESRGGKKRLFGF